MRPVDTSERAVADALNADSSVTATAFADTPDRLADRTLLVSCDSVSITPTQWECDITVSIWAAYQDASAGSATLTEITDQVLDAVERMRGLPVGYWLGPTTDVSSDAAASVTVDSTRYARTDIGLMVGVPRGIDPRPLGPAERTVRDVLAAANIPVVDWSDRPPFTVVRWVGTADDDPTRDMCLVITATEAESGQSEQRTRAVWHALRDSQTVTPIGAVAADPAGQPPGSSALYETTEITVTVLSPEKPVQ